jgi:DNA-binding XRE family transcriptional regulator
MTQADLALAIGTAPRFVVDLEAGKETCRLGLALAAAAAVGIDLVDGVMERARVLYAGGEQPTEQNPAPYEIRPPKSPAASERRRR